MFFSGPCTFIMAFRIMESCLWCSFCEDISYHVLGRNPFEGNDFVFNSFTDEVMFDVYMFGSFVKNGVVAKFYAASVAAVKLGGVVLLKSFILDE